MWCIARPPAVRLLCPGAPALFRPGPGELPATGSPERQQPGSCSKRSCVRRPTGIAWLGLSRSPAPRVCQRREEARRLSSHICPCLTRRHQRIHQECSREPSLPKRLPDGWPHQQRLARLREGSCAIAGRSICVSFLWNMPDPRPCPSFGCTGHLRP